MNSGHRTLRIMALATGGVLVLLVCAGLLLFLNGDPVVGGRTVQEWMVTASQTGIDPQRFTVSTVNVTVVPTVPPPGLTTMEQVQEAVKVLRELGPKAEPALMRALKAKETAWYQMHRFLWTHTPPPLKRYIKAPISPLGRRQSALAAIAKVGRVSPAIEALLREACNDPDQIVQQRAIGILGYRGSSSPETIRVFEAFMARKKTRDGVGPIAGNYRPRRPGEEFDFTLTTLEQMTQDLDRPYYEARYAAANALQNVGPAAAPAVPALIRNLSNTNDIVRNASIRALGCIGPAGSNALPALRLLLTHESQLTVSAAKEAIGKIEGARR